jgi:DNA ligase (NAD+)
MNKIQELEKKIKYHKAKYYQGHPEITDIKYDELEDELRKLNPKSKVLEIVGSAPTGPNKVSHDTKMLSLNKTYKLEELLNWINGREVVSMYKYDGVSCSLVYEDGKLQLAKTRGDGTTGENITSKAIWMNGVETIIPEKEKIEIRGEIYCTEEDFFHLSEEMESIGLDKPTSQRNIVAGLIGRKENLELNRYIQFCAFDLIEECLKLKTEVEKFEKLKKMGFTIPEVVLHKNEKQIKKVLEEAELFMAEGEFQIDGVVFSFNDLVLHEELGATAHHPRYKIAYKFQGEAKNTKIKKLVWQVSRNGILTPIAEVEPVELSGAKISRVTLHNYGLVKQFNLKKGDEIQIIRSGEVIPKFMDLVKSSQNAFNIPAECPSCSGAVEIKEIRLICNNEKCPAQVKETILNFIQKIGIDDLSSKRLEEMIKAELVVEIQDLYKLNKEQLMSLDKVKDKLATKLLTSIDKSKQVDITTFLSALGIQGGAYNKCERVVVAGYNSIEKILGLNVEKLMQVEGFAEKSASEFIKSLHEKDKLITDLVSLGFSFEEIEHKETLFLKKRICITGSLSRKRSEIEKVIREIGGIVATSVSKSTDFLITNDKDPTSTKFKKAIDLDIPVISEEEFFQEIEK